MATNNINFEKKDINTYLEWCKVHGVDPLDERNLKEFKSAKVRKSYSLRELLGEEILNKQIPSFIVEDFRNAIKELLAPIDLVNELEKIKKNDSNR